MNLIRVSQKLTVNQGNIKATVNGTGKPRKKRSLHIPLEILIHYVGFKTEYYNRADRVSGWVRNRLSFKRVFPLPSFFFKVKQDFCLTGQTGSKRRDQQRGTQLCFCTKGFLVFYSRKVFRTLRTSRDHEGRTAAKLPLRGPPKRFHVRHVLWTTEGPCLVMNKRPAVLLLCSQIFKP